MKDPQETIKNLRKVRKQLEPVLSSQAKAALLDAETLLESLITLPVLAEPAQKAKKMTKDQRVLKYLLK